MRPVRCQQENDAAGFSPLTRITTTNQRTLSGTRGEGWVRVGQGIKATMGKTRNPVRTLSRFAPRTGHARRHRAGWVPAAADIAWAKVRHPDLDVLVFTETFVLSCRAKGYRYSDPSAAWRRWLIEPKGRLPLLGALSPKQPPTRTMTMTMAARTAGAVVSLVPPPIRLRPCRAQRRHAAACLEQSWADEPLPHLPDIPPDLVAALPGPSGRPGGPDPWRSGRILAALTTLASRRGFLCRTASRWKWMSKSWPAGRGISGARRSAASGSASPTGACRSRRFPARHRGGPCRPRSRLNRLEFAPAQAGDDRLRKMWDEEAGRKTIRPVKRAAGSPSKNLFQSTRKGCPDRESALA